MYLETRSFQNKDSASTMSGKGRGDGRKPGEEAFALWLLGKAKPGGGRL